MGEGGRRGQPRVYRKEHKWLALFACGLIVYLFAATALNIASMWSWVWEPMGFVCKHPPLSANNSGVKVLIYGPAKSGTTGTTKFLHSLYPHAYHNEDMNIHIWSPLSDMFWQRPKNGGSIWPWRRLATISFPAYKSGSAGINSDRVGADVKVMKGLGAELRPLLADRLSRCRVDTLSFDGSDALFWPVYDVSPDAKIIMLDWRTFEEYHKSTQDFSVYTELAILGVNFLNVGQHILPWNAVVLPLWDALTGNKLVEHLRDGTPMAYDNFPLKQLFLQAVMERRIIQHWCSGFTTGIPWNAPDRASNTNATTTHIISKDVYEEYFNLARRHIPKERIFNLDLRKNTKMDLCRFLGKEDNPACDLKKIRKHRPSMLTNDPDHLEHFYYLVPLLLAIHCVNVKLISLFVCWFAGVLLRAVSALQLSLPTKKKKKTA